MTVAEIDEAAARVVLRECLVGGEPVMDGEATVCVPRRRRPSKGGESND